MEPNTRVMRSMVVQVTENHEGSATGGTPTTSAATNATTANAAPATRLRTDDFDEFCVAVQPSLARALALTLNDAELGRDAAAEGLTRAWARWSSVSAMDNPAGWVYRVGLNWARSRLRKRRREVTTAFPPDRSRTSGSVDGYDDAVAAALARLSPDHRAVVVARYFLDWSEATTAAALEVPAGTVKSRLSRALERLDDDLRSDG